MSPMRTRTAARLLRLPLRHGPLRRRALDTVWQAWLGAPDPALWTLLERRGCAASGAEPSAHALSRLALGDEDVALGPELLVKTATRFDHPIGERARAHLIALNDAEAVGLLCRTALTSPEATAFCVTHHLAPADEVERAAFFLRTGQHEQYRALDPDGALLALGYRGASSEERRALLETVTETGDIALLRVLAGRHSGPGGFASLGETERRRLLEQFAARRDWDHWWQLVQLMPLLDAVRAVQDAGAAWRPTGDDDLRVFEALRGAEAAALEAWTRDGLGDGSSRLVPARITMPGLGEPVTIVHDMDFAPDGTQLAVAGRVGDRGLAGIIDLGSGQLSQRYPDAARPLDQVAHLGADTIIAVDAEEPGDMHHPKRIHRFAPDGVRPLGFAATRIKSLQRVTGEGAFLVSFGQIDGFRWQASVSMGDRDGSLADSGILDGLPDVVPQIITVGPGGHRIAMVNTDTAVVADREGTVVNVLDNGPRSTRPRPLAAMSDTVLIRADDLRGTLDMWHEPLVSTRAPVSRTVWSSTTSLYGLAWSPALNRFVAIGRPDLSLFLWILDIPETRDSPLPDDLVARQVGLTGHPGSVRLSPKGDVLASLDSVSLTPTVELYYLPLLALRPRVVRPMGLMSLQDLSDVTAALESPALDHTSRPILRALHSCLEHRFRHDVGIGQTTDAGDFEIELGEV